MLLAERLRLVRVDMGGLLRERFRSAAPGEIVSIGGVEYSVEKQQQKTAEGKLCDSPFVAKVLQDRLADLVAGGKSVVIDGYPRAVDQIQPILPELRSLFGERIRLFVLEVSEEESICRNTHRRTCELMGHPILYSEETRSLTMCPLDGSSLVKRGDDDPEVLLRRLREMGETQIRPVAVFLEQEGVGVQRIDGSGSVAEVFERIITGVRL